MAKNPPSESTAEPIATQADPVLPVDVAQLVDQYWPTGGEAWQQQQAFRAREAFKSALATILSNQ